MTAPGTRSHTDHDLLSTAAPAPASMQGGGRSPEDRAIRTGLAAAVAAYAMWGLFPIFFKSIEGVSALEILAHRIVWSLPVAAIVISLRGQWREVRRALANRTVLKLLALSGVVIAANWLVYVWAVLESRVMEASLGYYINPLMYVAAGVLVLRERLRPLQAVAVGLASLGVAVLAIGAGVIPWVSIALAASFTTYGYIRKTVSAGAMPGLFVEICVLFPLAAVFLATIVSSGAAAFPHGGGAQNALLLLAGPITVAPLALFAIAARRLSLTTLGFIQYIGPTLQFFCGLYYGEPFTLFHAVCFGFIWSALAVFSIDAARRAQGR